MLTTIVVLFLLSLSCGLIGMWMLLKKNTMLANTMTHTVLTGVVITYITMHQHIDSFYEMSSGMLLFAAIFTALITNVTSFFLLHIMKVQKDVSIALTFSWIFAVGVMLINAYTRQTHLGLDMIMGSVDNITHKHILPCVLVLISVLVFVFVYYRLLIIDSLQCDQHVLSSQTVFHVVFAVVLSYVCVTSFVILGPFVMLTLLTSIPLIIRPWVGSIPNYVLAIVVLSFVLAVVPVLLQSAMFHVFFLRASTGGFLSVTCLLGVSLSYMLKRSTS
jgi:manganese/zinc/iron transport system permease protein